MLDGGDGEARQLDEQHGEWRWRLLRWAVHTVERERERRGILVREKGEGEMVGGGEE